MVDTANASNPDNQDNEVSATYKDFLKVPDLSTYDIISICRQTQLCFCILHYM